MKNKDLVFIVIQHARLFRRGSGGNCKFPDLNLGWFDSTILHQISIINGIYYIYNII